MLRLTLSLGLLLACFRLPAGALAQQPADGRPRVTELRFQGVSARHRALLPSAIVTTATRCKLVTLLRPICWFGGSVEENYLDTEVLRQDLLRIRLFYYQRGYRDARVEAEVEHAGKGERVTFRVAEGTPVRVASLTVAEADSLIPAAVARDLPLRMGEPFSLLDYEAGRDTLTRRLLNRGYARAEVLASYLIPSDSPDVAHVRYEALPGTRARFGAVQVVGTEQISPTVVRRMLTFEPGDVYRQEELLRSQRNLFALDLFQHAAIAPDLAAQPDSVIPVTVQVNEGNMQRVRLGAGLSNVECVNAEGRWGSRNFLGGARRLEARGRVYNIFAQSLSDLPIVNPCDGAGGERYNQLMGSLGLDLTEPWFFSPLTSLGAGIFVERRSVPEVYIRSARGGYLSLTRTLGRGTSLSLGYRPELTQLSASEFFLCINFVACSASEIGILQDPHRLAPLTFSLVRDRSNSLFAPTRGYVARLETEYASRATGSEFGYLRVAGDLAAYRELARGLVFAARVRPGWARAGSSPAAGDPLLHPQKRFFAGGPNSVRGYAQYRLGPSVLTVNAAEAFPQPAPGAAGCDTVYEVTINSGSCDSLLLDRGRLQLRPLGGSALLEGSLELRFPLLGDKLRGAAFLDYGNVWSDAGAVDLGTMVWTPGFGVRYFTAVGPFRVDVGYNPRGGERLRVIATEVDEVLNDEGKRVHVNTGNLRRLPEPIFWEPHRSFLERFQLHFSIGQAF